MISGNLADVKGIGKISLEKLKSAGLNHKIDLIEFVPYKYQEINFYRQIADIRPGEITIKARADHVFSKRGQRRFVQMTTAELYDNSGRVQAVWFNQSYRAKQISHGQFYFSGNFGFARGKYQLTNPSVVAVTASSTKKLTQNHIRPIYSQIRGLKTTFTSKIMAGLATEILLLPEILPQIVLQKGELIDRSQAYYYLHFPQNQNQIKQARRRQLVERYFIASLASYLTSLENTQLASPTIKQNLDFVKQMVADLQFKLTDDQRKAIWQILQNFELDKAMNCLLQGDVGSGKTIVAIIVAAIAIKSGYQVAFMAPTEILAKQHFKTISQILQAYQIKTALLTSSTTKKQKNEIYNQLAIGKIDIIVGTHALIQADVKFKNLGLAIIDEQHRFGVLQRQELAKKAKIAPHLLSMTATPIPRSLALILKKELQVISIKQKPIGRLAIQTKIISTNKRRNAYDFIKQELNKGKQAYIVCGLIDESEDVESNRQNVTNLYTQLTKNEFKNYKIGVIHGKLKSAEKDQIMTDFLTKKYDLLIATTVIEVGVDVANATVMMIEDANYFGLSQLHQLRGRIGRSDQQSYCFLVDNSALGDSARLKIMEKSDDGFYLSQMDLKMRGAGDLFGQSQHGWFDLETDLEAIELADKLVDDFINDLVNKNQSIADELTKYPVLKTKIDQFDNLTILN